MVTIPTFDLSLLPPAEISVDLVGSAVMSPRAVSGAAAAMDFSGGGFWKVELKRVQIFADSVSHREWCRLSALLAGGVRRIVVPLITDITAPTIIGIDGPVITGIPYDDGTYHSDGAGHLSAAALAVVATDTVRGAGTIAIRMLNGGTLFGGETFSIHHLTRGWRAYRVVEVDSIVDSVHTVAIRPPLRDVAPAGATVDFWRPRVTMTLPAGVTMPWAPSGFWKFTPDVTFVEALGS